MNDKEIKNILKTFIDFCEIRGMVAINENDYGENQPSYFDLDKAIEDFINDIK